VQTPFGDPSGNQRKRSEPKDDSLSGALEQDSSRDERNEEFRSDQGFLRRWFVIRDAPGSIERLLLGVGCIALLLLGWHLLTMGEKPVLKPTALPSLPDTAQSFHSLWFERALARGAVASLSRVLGGFLLAAAIAVPLGVVAGCYPRFHAFARPLSIFGRNIPIAALIPLSLIWFGIEDIQKVMFIFMAAVAFIFFDTTQSLRLVPGHFLDTAYTLGARTNWRQGWKRASKFGLAYAFLAVIGFYWMTKKPVLQAGYLPASGTLIRSGGGFLLGTLLWLPVHNHQAISKVLFPLALPYVINSMRLLFGLAFGYIMLAEVINAELGLGKIILISQRQGPREHIYLCLIAIALLAFGIDRLVMFIQRRAFPYVTHGH